MARVLLPIGLLALSGCRCQGPVSSRRVQIERFRTLVSARGSEQLPFDLENADLYALITEDAGERVVYPQIDGPGRGTFFEIPDGPYLIYLNGYYLRTNENALDLGAASLGRRDVGLSDGGVRLELNVQGLSPWVPYSDVLQVVAANTGYVALSAQNYVSEGLDAGVVDARLVLSYDEACSTARGGLVPLVDVDAGSDLIVTQLVVQPVPDGGRVEARALLRAATVPPFTVAAQGTTTTPLIALSPPGRRENVSIDFRQSGFAALSSAVHPEAQVGASSLTVSAIPFTADYGAYTSMPDLAVIRPLQLDQDVQTQVELGNPFPPSWPKVVTARFTLFVNYRHPEGGTRFVTTSLVSQTLLGSDGGVAALSPTVGPPRSLRIDGADALQRSIISRVATLSWEPPALGTPTSYGITLLRFTKVGPVISLSEEDFFETRETRLKIPFGDLDPDGEYVFGLTAFASPSAEVERAPFRGGLPFSAATTLSAMVKVEPRKTP